MKHTKTTFKLSLLAGAIFMATSVSSVELAQQGNSIIFDSLENTQYSVTVRSPEGEVFTFQSNNGEFSLSAKMLGVETLKNGLYKYEMAPVFSAGVISKEVRDLNDETVTAEYLKSLKTNAQPQSGVFTISDDILVDKNLIDPSTTLAKGSVVNDSDVATRDQVILDDLIVDGSICAGQDCVNGESFGFDTIRLKENNLRIRAVDTSSTSSFPSRDWQLTFNDSANGGANKFSIDDIDGGRTPFTLEAGAPSHSLYVDDGGRLGLGTNTPVVDVHVKSGNTPTMRLEQDGTSGFTPQTWDVAGNEANFFVRDATNGSTLPFKIFPGAPSNALTVEATSGDIGMGTTSPDGSLEIDSGTSNTTLLLTQAGTTAAKWEIKNSAGTGRLTMGTIGGNVAFKMESTANSNLFRVGQDGTGTVAANTVSIGGNVAGQEAVLDVRGSINVDGSEVHADFVFADDYKLKTIEDRAQFMWREKHLPSLPKAPEGLTGSVNLVGHQMGILEELEVAHIYIEQLNNRLNSKDFELNEVKVQFTQLAKRLEKLEAK